MDIFLFVYFMNLRLWLLVLKEHRIIFQNQRAHKKRHWIPAFAGMTI